MSLLLTVTRSIDLDAPVERVWDAIATPSGLAAWIGGDVDMVLAPGAAGWITTDGARRRAVVTEVVDGTRVAFAWWPEDDAEAVSSVVIDLTGDTDHATVTVTETVEPLAAHGGRVSMLADATVDHLAEAWSGRLGLLAERLSPVFIGV